MQETKGTCTHGSFVLTEGCPKCIAERRQADQKPEPFLVKVQYYSETTNQLSPREYTYYSAERLNVGDVVTVPVRDTTGKAIVSAIDVPEAEIAAFKDRVKTIPAGSFAKAKVTPEQQEMEQGLNAEGLTLANVGEPVTITESLLEETAPETAIAPLPGADVQAMGYWSQALKLLDYANARAITTYDDLEPANDDLAIIGELKRVVETRRVELVKPMQDAVNGIQATYKEIMAPVLEADRITRAKVLAFHKDQERIHQEQERINQMRMDAAKAEMELGGELTESVNLVEVQPPAPTRVITGMGSTGMRANWTYEVVDFALLPDAYKVADAAQLNAIAKSHHDKKPVAGVRFYDEPTLVVKKP